MVKTRYTDKYSGIESKDVEDLTPNEIAHLLVLGLKLKYQELEELTGYSCGYLRVQSRENHPRDYCTVHDDLLELAYAYLQAVNTNTYSSDTPDIINKSARRTRYFYHVASQFPKVDVPRSLLAELFTKEMNLNSETLTGVTGKSKQNNHVALLGHDTRSEISKTGESKKEYNYTDGHKKLYQQGCIYVLAVLKGREPQGAVPIVREKLATFLKFKEVVAYLKDQKLARQGFYAKPLPDSRASKKKQDTLSIAS